MSKPKQEVILRQTDLLAGQISNPTTSFNGLSISTIVNFLELNFLKGNFRSDFFGILLITKGKFEIKINLLNYHLNKNDLIVVPPNAVKQYVRATKGCTAIGVSFTTHFLSQSGLIKHSADLFDYLSTKTEPRWQLKPEDAEILKDSISALQLRCQMVSKHPYGKEMLYHTFFNFIYEMGAQAQKYTRALNQQLTRKEDLTMRFASLVNKHYKSQRSVQYYADLLHVTAKYLTETVKEISGKNAGEIIDDFVMLEAKVLLENPNLSIAQIAEELHFSDQSFFGKFFKRHTGISPKSYRISNLI